MSTAHTSFDGDVPEHPAGHMKKRLLWLRSLQVVLSALSSAISIYILAVVAHVAEVVMAEDGQGGTRYMSPALAALVAAAAVGVALSLLCLSLCLTWLVFTAAPNRRARSCGGNRVPCLRHNCDMGWDITWAILWGMSGIWGCVAFTRNQYVVVQVVSILLNGAVCGAFISTAIISGKIRNRMRAGAAARDIEAAGYMTDGTRTAPQPSEKISPR